MSQVAGEVLGRTAGEGLAVLSGPNFSQEIARGLPAAAVLASQQESTAQKCQALFASAMFRVYTNCDIIGVELCGAVKNVIALAAGMSDGLGYGENAKAALITRGLAEMASLVALAGGVPHTCYGLAGVGDLVATCHSPLSRNWQMGYRVGQGQSPGAAQAAVAGVVEGVYTSAAVLALAQKRVVLPIAEAVHAVLYCGQAPAEVAAELMRRPWRAEGFDW
jgi:glycerol-3-phosphate dehydrogenase (NAD(P)+)